MEKRTMDRFKLGTLGAGVIALCVTGAAGAVNLITGKKIKNGTIQYKDLSKKAKNKIIASVPVPTETMLVSSFSYVGDTNRFVAPGSDLSSVREGARQLLVPAVPSSGFRVRGLKVRAQFLGKTELFGADSQRFTLRLNGSDTALSCETDSANVGICNDEADILVTPGDRLSIQAEPVTSTTFTYETTIALTLEPA